MRNIMIIARRDLRAQFNSPVAYVVIGGSMLLLGVLFFLVPHTGNVLLGSFWEIDRASMDQMFLFLPPLMSLFVIPAITMRSIAAEKSSGTLELLITMPVRDSEVILGKYLASCVLVVILLAASLLYPIVLFWAPWHLGTLDWGPIWSGYLGCLMFSFAAVGVGLMLSSLTDSDVIAFFLTASILCVLYAIGWMASLLPGAVGDTISFFSFQTRYQSFARGLIDSRAIVYFLSVAILCLLVSFRSLESRKWS
ncbi:MAG TPA: ABC transporter permease subunit [Polyangiaceae bacterium]|jgi:ABC-2 type transport system permease protein|nr:ABC transporter permease subunit [Polyangiaceae bacterium]